MSVSGRLPGRLETNDASSAPDAWSGARTRPRQRATARDGRSQPLVMAAAVARGGLRRSTRRDPRTSGGRHAMWHIFHPEVSARGGMATPFIQAQWGPSVGIWRPDGICMPLVCSWLAGQEHGRDFVAQPHDNAFIQAVRRLAMNFYSSQHTWDSNYPDVALAPLGLALQNLRMVRPRTGMPVPDADFAGEMRDYLLYEPPARYFVGFTGYCGATSNQILTHTI